MNRDDVYNKEIRPLMAKIIKTCKKNKIAFAAQFMMNETESYISVLSSKGLGRTHITQVLMAMDCNDIDQYDQKITRHGIRYGGEWYWSEKLLMNHGRKVRVIPDKNSLKIISDDSLFETIETFQLS